MRRPLLSLALLTLLLLAILPRVILANGGTLRVANVPMGAYLVSIFTDPTPVRPDSLDVSVLAVWREDGRVAEGLDVRVRARLVEGRSHADHAGGEHPARERIATPEEADDPRYYATKFALGMEGVWEIEVAVRGPEGEGEASFQLTARDRGLLGNPLVLILLALVPLIAVGGWVLRQGGKPDSFPPRSPTADPDLDTSGDSASAPVER